VAAFAPATPEGAGAGCWLDGVCADWGCGVSGSGLLCCWLTVLDWLDWGGLASRGISLEITKAPANMATERHFEYLQPVRFIYALPVLER
jgi:hypothetical protein